MRTRFFYWGPIFLFWLFGSLLLLLFEKGDIHYAINSRHHPATDFFFSLITHLGGGITVIFLLFLLAWKRHMAFWELFAGIAFGIGVVALFKYLLFPEMPRPVSILEGLYLVPGIENDTTRSFPSGHTTAIFCIAGVLAGISTNKWQRLSLAIIALVVGYSRMYISQHFLSDVLAGSMLGALSAFFGQTLLKFIRQIQSK
jgi:membrane-associated phospholipid phosphatase